MPRKSKPQATGSTVGPHPFAFLVGWRESAGLTQENVGETLGVTGVTVHRWETGKTAVTTSTWFALSKLYGASHPSQLWFPPHLRDRAAALESAWAVIAALPADQLQRWIEMGADLARAANPGASADAAQLGARLQGNLRQKE
jgi:transcriptional regulator with XRE-family HTH domain